MCRGKDECSELGTNPANWNKESLLQPPNYFNQEIDIFVKAVDEFINGDKEECLKLISSIKSKEMQNWFIEHGQMSGRHRKNILNIPKPQLIDEKLRDKLRSPRKYQNKIFERDGYKCRFCGNRLISQEFIKLFIKKLDSPIFQKGATNLSVHGIIINTWPVADHVFPWNMGGQTNFENLVSSCGGCNYGKDGYTCEQLGIENPLLRKPILDKWDGLLSRMDELKRV